MRVLIVGADSTIGGAAAQALRARGHAVIGTTRRAAEAAKSDNVVFDLAAGRAADLPPIDVAVICAAMTRLKDCRENPELARQVNVEGPTELARRSLSAGARVLLLSTSAVFDCKIPGRKPDDPREPRSVYGQLKAEAESRLLAMGTGASVLRLSKLLRQDAGVPADWIGKLAAGETVAAFDDHRISPVLPEQVTTAIAAIVESGEEGIFQISGADDVSYAEAARHLAARLGVPATRVMSVPASSGIPPEEITPYTSLDTARLSRMTRFMPPRAFDVLDAIFGTAIEKSARKRAERR